MGLFEVLHHLPRLLRLRARVRAAMLALKPDVFVGIDAPEFNLGLAPALHAAGLRTVQYVSPQVWAWRRGRARAWRVSSTSCSACCRSNAASTTQAGLARRSSSVTRSPTSCRSSRIADAARRALGLAPEARVVAVLPGSRGGEVSRLAPTISPARSPGSPHAGRACVRRRACGCRRPGPRSKPRSRAERRASP